MFDQVTRIPGWNLYGLALGIIIFSALHIALTKDRSKARVSEIVLMYTIGITGFNGITGFVVHTLYADMIAESIGWEAGSPFQTEVAGANLGVGLIGFLGFWRRDFWLPHIIAKTCFSWTAGVTHVMDIAQRNNLNPGNAGPILYWDCILHVILIGLYILHRRTAPAEPSGYIRTQPLTEPEMDLQPEVYPS